MADKERRPSPGEYVEKGYKPTPGRVQNGYIPTTGSLPQPPTGGSGVPPKPDKK